MFRSASRWLVASGTVALLVSALPVSLTGAGTVTVTVKKGGVVVPGAFVALVGTGGNKHGGVTDSAGIATFANVPDDTYSVKAAGDGTSVGTGAITVPGPASLSLGVNPSGNVFSPLGVFGASTLQLVSGGQPGVFFLSASAIPSLWRTVDYGGTWSPVTSSTDDPVNGIGATDSTRALSASGYPGEVAAVVAISGSPNSLLWYSRDFGVTWSSVPLPAGSARNGARTFWSHPTAAGAPSILFFVFDGTSRNTSTDIYYAVMPTDSASPAPVLTKMSASYRTSASDPIALASGSDAPVFAVAHTATGTVDLYKVDSTPDASDPKVTLTGVLPTVATDGSALAASDAFQIQIGGPASGRAIGTTVAPNTVLLYSNKGDTAANVALLTCTSAGCTSTTATQFKDGGDVTSTGSLLNFGGGSGPTCGMGRLLENLGASISPLGAAGTLGACWVSSNSGTLEVRGISNITQKPTAFDAGYGTGSGLVILTTHEKGAIKSARAGTSTSEGLNRPFFPRSPVAASAGTASTSGGIAINGLTIPLVTGLAFSPQSPNHMVTSLSGGARILGSTNAGNAWFTLLDRAGQSVTWWAGAGTSSWILGSASTSPGGDLLAGLAVASQQSFSSVSTLTQMSGTTAAAMGLGGTAPPGDDVPSIAGIPGTNRAILALSRPNQDPCCVPNTGALAFITLGANLSATITPIASTFTNSAPASVAYCPASGSAASVADKAFVAVRSFPELAGTGGIRVIANVSTAPAVQAVSGLAGDFRVIKVHCATGTIWAGRHRLDADPTRRSGLLRSTDGGVTFSTVSFTGTLLQAMGNVSLLAIHPTNPKKVLAGSQNVDVIQTNDGGFTWTFLNDTITPCDPARPAKCGRHFGSQAPNALELPGLGLNNGLLAALTSQARTSVRTDDGAVVGSGAGLYATVTRSIDRIALSYAATLSSGALNLTSPAQDVAVSLSSATTWTATADQPWLSISPASGTGSGKFTVSLVKVPGLPASGVVRATITLTTAGATESVQYLDVTLTVATSTSVPFGVVDTPAEGATGLQGSFAVTGWTLDDVGVERVEIWRDLQPGETTPPFANSPTDPRTGKIFIANATFVDGARPDVEAANPDTPVNYRAGWGYLLLSQGLWNQGNGTYKLYAFGFDKEQQVSTIGTKTIAVSNAQANRPFGAIDTPGIGATVGGTVVNFGWGLTPLVNGAATCKIQPSGVQVSIDSGPLQPVVYGTARSDIAGGFPGLSNSTAAGGHFFLDTTQLLNGTHTIGWLITDDCNRADGVGSRFFTTQNSGLAAGPAARALSGGVVAAPPMISLGAADASRDSGLAVTVAHGYGQLPVVVEPDGTGLRAVHVTQGDRIELRIPRGYDQAFQTVNGTRRALPAGATWDPAAGAFYWQPAAAFLASFEIVFGNGAEQIRVRIFVDPQGA